LSEADVDEILGEIRTALLEADVNVGVVRSVLARIRDKAVGAEVSKALDPAHHALMKFVRAGEVRRRNVRGVVLSRIASKVLCGMRGITSGGRTTVPKGQTTVVCAVEPWGH
jgi:signal recognition particle subunit SRP54